MILALNVYAKGVDNIMRPKVNINGSPSSLNTGTTTGKNHDNYSNQSLAFADGLDWQFRNAHCKEREINI